MDKIIEQLRKEALPIHPKCVGQGFSDEEKQWLDIKHPVCSRIDPIEIYEIIDEETGAVDTEVPPTLSNIDEACRCTAYAFPNTKWKTGWCPLATHFNPIQEEAGVKVRVGQQKQKKKR